MNRLNSASIRWESGVPVSQLFDDIYFNKDGGIAETEHVFVQGNHLLERFSQLQPYDTFTLAETGFGTGLNFLVTRQYWLKHAPSNARLHFISLEKYPLAKQDIEQVWQSWQPLADICPAFIAQYPPALEGFYTLFFDQGRIQLTLILGDLLEQLPQLRASIDAWYLDGFAPSKNPEMWQAQLYEQIARLSSQQATLATFTVARQVREGLTHAGFLIEKRPGFGKKREMLIAKRQLTDSAHHQTKPQRVLVVGAGLAGACTARMLAERGIAVTLIEAQAGPAQQGSGNAQGALYAKLAVKPTAESALHLQGLLYSVNLLKQLPTQNPPLADLCGVLQLACSEKETHRQALLLQENRYPDSLLRRVDAQEASELMGCNTPFSGVFFPDAGWVAPADYCHYLLDHPLINCRFNETLLSLTPFSDGWQLTTDREPVTASHVVICTAADARKIPGLEYLPIKPIRGQTTLIDADRTDIKLKTVVCGEGYISPSRSGEYCFGATFDLHYHDRACRDSDHQKNIDQLAKAIPAFSDLTPDQCKGRTGFRCSTADYLPLVGEAPDDQSTVKAFASLRYDANSCQGQPIPRLKGLYVNLGHGSKGLITCPISAAVITGMITNEPCPLPYHLLERIDPVRFILRDLSKRRI